MSICSVYLQISTFLVLSNCIFSNSESVRKILLLNPFGIPSHNVLFETVASTLANAHPDDYELTLVTNSEWKLKEEFPNVKVFQQFKTDHFRAQYLGNICFKLNNHQELRNVMQEKKFDLVIVNGHVHECLYGLLHLMKTPFIVLISTPPPSYVAEPLGNFLPPSIVPLTITDLSDKMTFGQRSKNFLYFVFSKVFVKRNMMPEFESVYRDHLGDNMPSFSDILSNASMIFANGHFAVNFPRPSLPDIVDIAGIHCRDGQKLPENIEKFMSESKNGVIYFSLGSLSKFEDMSESFWQAVIKVFSQLKEHIIWKINQDLDTFPEPTLIALKSLKNIMFTKWVPQQDVLAHPNLKLFISQGGLLSIQEAVYHSVPILVMPVGVNQNVNMKRTTEFGSGITLWANQVNEKTFHEAVTKILTNKKFSTRIQEQSKIFKAREQSPDDKLVYWVDYVIRYHGATHLRSGARHLNTIQYFSLDVLLFWTFALACIIFLIFNIFYFCQCCIRSLTKMCSGPPTQDNYSFGPRPGVRSSKVKSK